MVRRGWRFLELGPCRSCLPGPGPPHVL